MAPVSDGRNRAQLILIGALALAVSLVAIALVLNSAIYTHNLASRYQSPADAPVTFERDARLGAGGLMDEANGVQTTYGGVETDYTDELGALEEASAKIAAVNGRSVTIEHDSGSEVEGVRIIGDGGGEFHPAGSSDNKWMVARDVRVRQFEVTIDGTSKLTTQSQSTTESNLVGGPSADAAQFVIEFDDTAGTVRYIAVYEDGGPTVMVHDGSSMIGTCSTSSTTVKLDVTGERFAGSSCPELGMLESLSKTYNVRFHGGDHISGTYGLTADLGLDGSGSGTGVFTDLVDEENYGDHCFGPTYNAPGGSSPHVSPAWYSADLQVVYSGSDTANENLQRVANAEPGNKPVTPRVTQFDVADSSSGDDSFEVTWGVTNPDTATSDLGTVDIEISDGDDESPISVSGDSAGPTTTVVTDSGGGSGPYDISITVTDTAGNSRTITQRHQDDGDGSGDGSCPE